MKRYVVSYVSFFDNELILEEVSANSEYEAFWQHSKLQCDDWGTSKEDTKGMDSKELQSWSFEFDMLVGVLELS